MLTYTRLVCGIAGFLLTHLLLPGCVATTRNFENKFAPARMKADAALAFEAIEKCHPGVGLYATRDQLADALDQLNRQLNDTLDAFQFRLRLSRALGTLRCGHTTVRASPNAPGLNELLYREGIFPLQLKCWGKDSMVVYANAWRNDSIFRRGTIVTSINGMSARFILDSLVQFIPADGFNHSLSLQIISNGFPAYFFGVFGKSENYQVGYIDSSGKNNLAVVKHYIPAKDTARRRQALLQGASTPSLLREKRSLSIDTPRSLAVMQLHTFSPAGLQKFFRKSFKTIKKEGLKNLAIDLRINTGGSIQNSTRLTRYLAKQPFRVCDTMAAVGLHLPDGLVAHRMWMHKWQRFFFGRRGQDGRIHFRMYERQVHKPKRKAHFDGNVFIITSGQSFSASTLFISPLRGQSNVRILGEETGGAAYGNNAVHIPEVVLPQTGIRFRLPLYRIVISNKIAADGRGILPDISVPPSSYHILSQKDPKMEKLYELIEMEKKQ